MSKSVTVADLIAAKACTRGIRIFQRTFPNGASWPEDRDKARAAGLDLRWAQGALKLPGPKEKGPRGHAAIAIARAARLTVPKTQ